MFRKPLCAALLLSAAALASHADQARADRVNADERTERGKYLVALGGCNDCHTPGNFLGKPDFAHALSGSEVGFEIPGMGVFHGPNLTPDKVTGLGDWSEEQIVTTLRTGRRPDGRMLAPAMPWMAFSVLTDADAYAIAAYLKSLPAVANKVPGPFGPTAKPTGFVMRVVAPQNE